MNKLIFKILAVLISILWLLPLCCLLVGTSMKADSAVLYFAPLETGSGYVALHLGFEDFTFSTLLDLLFKMPNFYRAFWNTGKLVFPTVIVQILVSTPAGWAFAIYDFKGKRKLYFIYLLLMVLPFAVTMLSAYRQMKFLNLLGNYLAIILPVSFQTLPVFIMELTFRKVPKELIESARAVGANEFQIFCHVGIALGWSGIFINVLCTFLIQWNEIARPLLLLHDPLQLPFTFWLFDVGIPWSLPASAIVAIPPLALFLYGMKQTPKTQVNRDE